MQLVNKLGLAPAALAVLALAAAPPAHADTALSGNYSNNPTTDGYEATNGASYIVTGTFNHNDGGGLYASDSTITVKAPATFEYNLDDGLSDNNGTDPLTVTGGTFSNNDEIGLYAVDIPTTVSGGTFSDNGQYGLAVYNTNATVSGGTFGGNLGDDLSAQGGTITLVGTDLMFTAPYAGDTSVSSGTLDTIVPGNGALDTVSGTLTGYLANNPGVFQTLSFVLNTIYTTPGSIVLDNQPASAVPEPSTVAPFALAGLGLLGLTLRARRRNRGGGA